RRHRTLRPRPLPTPMARSLRWRLAVATPTTRGAQARKSAIFLRLGRVARGISGDFLGGFRRRERNPFAQSKETERGFSSNLHWANFLDAIRSGRDKDMHSDIQEGHLSTSLCHLANISCRLGRSLKFIGEKEAFANDAEADVMLTRDY